MFGAVPFRPSTPTSQHKETVPPGRDGRASGASAAETVLAPWSPAMFRASVREHLAGAAGLRVLTSVAVGAIDALLFSAIVGMTVVSFLNIVLREFFSNSLPWSLEVEQLGLTVLAFMGGARAFITGDDRMSFELLVARVPARYRSFVESFQQWCVAGAGVLLALTARDVLRTLWFQRTPILFIHMTWYALPIVIGGVLIAFSALLRAFSRQPRQALGAGITFAALTGLMVLAHDQWGSLSQHTALALIMLIFAGLLVIGVSIGIVLLSASFAYLYLAHSAPLIAVPLAMSNSMDNLVLLALPLFIFAGFLMLEGGLAMPLARFVEGLTGRIPGGSLHALVAGTYIFSGLSGSKYADVAAVGSIMKSSVSEADQKNGHAAAVLAASAAMGETIPPSIALIVLGSITSLSVSSLFFAGVVPATMIAVALMLSIYVRSKHRGASAADTVAPPGIVEVVRRAVVAIPALAIPVILIGGIVGGVATPTEVSSFAVVYAILISALLYRKAGIGKQIRIAIDSAVMAGLLLFVVATASAFSWALAAANVPQDIASGIQKLGGGPVVLFTITIVTLIVMGSFLEGLPALLIFGPLLLPIASLYGINQLQYGIVICIAMGIGVFMPPIGIGSYLASSVFGTKIEATTRAFALYFVVLVLGLVLIAIFPQLTTAVPNLLR